MLKRLRSVLHATFGRRHFEDGLADEVRFHIEQYTDGLVRFGVSPEEAARRARLEFGSVDSVKDDCREARGLRLLDVFREPCGTPCAWSTRRRASRPPRS